MEGNESRNVTSYLSGGLLALFSIVIWICGPLAIISLAVIAVVSFVVTKVLLTKFNFLPNLVPPSFLHLSSATAKETVHNKQAGSFRLCLACGDISCERHDIIDSLPLNPWHDLRVNGQLNHAVEELLNKLIESYVESWFKQLLQHESDAARDTRIRDSKFVLEIKYMIRYAVANLLLRFTNVDLVKFVKNDFLIAATNHIATYQIGKRKSKSAQFIEETVLQEFEKDNLIHPAVLSAENESIFLRKLSTLLLPHLLPPKYLNCSHAKTLVREIISSLILKPVIDALSDPCVLNKLIAQSDAIALQTIQKSSDASKNEVDVLTGYSVSSHHVDRENVDSNGRTEKIMFGITLKQVADDAQLLFLFMQFLKEEGAVNLIQFYLAFEALSLKLMNPDLSEDGFEDLFSDVQTLYRSFIDPESVDCIQFSDPKVLTDVLTILSHRQESFDCLTKLRTCESLYSASFEVNSLLEKHYLDAFFETSFYFKMVSGPRLSAPSATVPSLVAPDIIPKKFRSKHRRQASMTSLKRSVKESFWPSPDDGIIPPSASFSSFPRGRSSSLIGIDQVERGVDLLESLNYNRSVNSLLEPFPSEVNTNELQRSFNSMTGWKVSIPEIGTRLDPSLKYFHVFVIDVSDTEKTTHEKEDPSYNQLRTNSWRIERRYHEFYALESKLKEFHGESLLTYPGFYPLPSRNWSFISAPKQTIHLLRTKKKDFEKFLSSLVTCEKLHGSRLVYNFLNDSAEFASNSITDSLNIKKIMKNVPAKLTSERGQHLEPFLATLIHSAFGPTKTPNEDDDVDLDPSDFSFDTQQNSSFVYLNQSTNGSETVADYGAFDCLLFLLVRIFGFAPTSTSIALFIASEPVIRQSLDSLLIAGIAKFISRIVEPDFLTPLVDRLKSLLFDPVSEEDGLSQRKYYEEKALVLIQNRVKSILVPVLLSEKVDESAFLIYSVIQHQTLNKQFLYMLLDSLVVKLFPNVVLSD